MRRWLRSQHNDAGCSRAPSVARCLLTCGARLQQGAGRRSPAQHGGEPVPAGRNAAVHDGADVCFAGPLSLALVPIQASDLHGGWPPGIAPRRETVSAWIVVEQGLPSRDGGGPTAASCQWSGVGPKLEPHRRGATEMGRRDIGPAVPAPGQARLRH
jgi:hypothetical protein